MPGNGAEEHSGYRLSNFIQGMGLIKELIRGGAQWIIEGRGARAGFYGPLLIHTYMDCPRLIYTNIELSKILLPRSMVPFFIGHCN
jgi:hypothetical protein